MGRLQPTVTQSAIQQRPEGNDQEVVDAFPTTPQADEPLVVQHELPTQSRVTATLAPVPSLRLAPPTARLPATIPTLRSLFGIPLAGLPQDSSVEDD